MRSDDACHRILSLTKYLEREDRRFLIRHLAVKEVEDDKIDFAKRHTEHEQVKPRSRFFSQGVMRDPKLPIVKNKKEAKKM